LQQKAMLQVEAVVVAVKLKSKLPKTIEENYCIL
jgi:hypothetical protein